MAAPSTLDFPPKELAIIREGRASAKIIVSLMPGDDEAIDAFISAERERTGYPVKRSHAASVLIHRALLAWKR